MTLGLFSKPANRKLIGLIVAAMITGGIAYYGISQYGQRKTPQPTATVPVLKKVTALGRIEPEGEVIRLSAPLALDGDRIAQILVQEGDSVQAGQVVAILDSRDRLQDALQQAQQQVKVTQARLAQVKAGAKRGEIQAQQATITRLEAELAGEIAAQNAAIARWQSEVRNADAEYNRFQQLYRQGAIAASSLDNKRLIAETAQAQLDEAQQTQSKTIESLQAQLKEARATLNQIAEVRPVDIEAAQSEVAEAIASVKRAQTDLAQAYIKAPTSGQILRIHSRVGEKISDSGIADLAQTDTMLVVAEVYQTDINKVKPGQTATITSEAIAGELQGVVSHVGLQVDRQNVFSNQPGENLDRRVVEVKIRLNPTDSKQVAGLTNLQVQTAIQL
ncbi:ABC exporter membrane fusion protein [Gloeocapsopsis dulcis]|uniref:HlyD family secretion protein n=1 Tax=Gloeocapsopsis dulcis AAB1 = 1H9 TaxID=1433147 RepID=A0A6N8FRI5_9CHRO|nr:ABC exporter membrane fusion protein [Gloeocapsopsis dulcis]MUL35750.1 HlyD family secretion protein [Gloeocapsopsis dulcis AAB1 = 1H9]WNN90966.1 ABC exporter membrane fusion protein [Gloeocapsopsis dulcis]